MYILNYLRISYSKKRELKYCYKYDIILQNSFCNSVLQFRIHTILGILHDLVIVYFAVLRKRIQLVIQLFRLGSRCSFSMMVKWANHGLLQANDGKMLTNDGGNAIQRWWNEYDHILTSPSLTSIGPSLARSKPSFAHLTIIEKLFSIGLGL